MATAQAEVCVLDDYQRKVCVKQLHAVVSLAPHLTELWAYVGGLSSLKAVDIASDFPKEVASLPRVGDAQRLDLERLASFKPDLVLFWGSGNGPDTLQWLQDNGVPVYVSEPKTLQDVAGSIEDLGALLGDGKKQAQRALQWLDQFETLKVRHEHLRLVPVFYQVWEAPLMSLGGDHLISKLIRMCGGLSVTEQMTTLAGQVGLETVIAANPELIVTSGPHSQASRSLEHWKQWPGLTAVGMNNLTVLPNDVLVRQGPRLLEGATLLCQAIDNARKKGDQ